MINENIRLTNKLDGKIEIYFSSKNTIEDIVDTLKFYKPSHIIINNIDDFECVPNFDFVEFISISNETGFIKNISHLSFLKALNIKIKTKNNVKFTGLKSLEKINFIWNKKYKKEDLIMPSLAFMTILKYNEIDFNIMPVLNNLKDLEIQDTSLINFKGIDNFPNLKSLTIRNAKNLCSIGEICSLLQIKRIYIEDARLINDISVISNIKLEELYLINVIINDVSFIYDMHNLKTLTITGVPITNIDWYRLFSLERIRKVSIFCKNENSLLDENVISFFAKKDKKIILEKIQKNNFGEILVISVG